MGRDVAVGSPPQAVPFEDVVRRHAAYVWNVARGVLRDAALAEDACQEAFLALLGRREPFAADAALRVWLGRVAHNSALKRLRSRGRRRRREEAVASGVRGRSDAMDVETRDTLHALVDDLPDEERLVVRLKYFQKLPQREIADVMAVSAGTVSNRLHDALDRLRKGVARAGAAPVASGLESGLEAFAPEAVPAHVIAKLAGLGASAPAAATAGGVSLLAKIAVSVVVVAAGVVAAFTVLPTGESPASSSSGGGDGGGRAVAARAANDGGPHLVGRPGAASEEGGAAGEAAGSAPGAAAPPPPPGASSFALRGVVWAPDRRPAAGAEVQIGPRPKSSGRDYRRTRADADGRWSFEGVPPGRWWDLVVRREGSAPVTIHLGRLDGPPEEPVTVQLRPSWSIRVVLRGENGETLTGKVGVVLREGRGSSGFSRALSKDGRLEIPELDPREAPPEETSLEIRHPRFEPLVLRDWAERIGPDGWAVADVRLRRGAEVRGVVRGPEGEPVGGAQIVLLPEGLDPRSVTWDHRETTSDADGSYAFEGLPQGSFVLRGRAEGLVLEHALALALDRGQRVAKDLSFGHGRTIVGRIVDTKGRPLTRVQVDPARDLRGLGWMQGTPVDEEGRFRIEGLTLDRRVFQVHLLDVPSSDPQDLDTEVLRQSPREVEVLVRSRTVQPEPRPAPEAGAAEEEDAPGPGRGQAGQWEGQMLIPSASIQVAFPPE